MSAYSRAGVSKDSKPYFSRIGFIFSNRKVLSAVSAGRKSRNPLGVFISGFAMRELYRKSGRIGRAALARRTQYFKSPIALTAEGSGVIFPAQERPLRNSKREVAW